MSQDTTYLKQPGYKQTLKKLVLLKIFSPQKLHHLIFPSEENG